MDRSGAGLFAVMLTEHAKSEEWVLSRLKRAQAVDAAPLDLLIVVASESCE